jgi:hypothetical protein
MLLCFLIFASCEDASSLVSQSPLEAVNGESDIEEILIDSDDTPTETPSPLEAVNGESDIEEMPDIVPDTDILIENTNEDETLTENLHYYAIALQEFMRNASGRTSAILFDLDGCGYYEMIAFDEGIAANARSPFSYNEGGEITIFDTKTPNNPSTMELQFFINSYDMYISNENYIILSFYGEGTMHQIFRYENERITEIAQLGYSMMGFCHWWFNDIEINEVQYYDYLEGFGAHFFQADIDIDDSAIMFGSSRTEIPLQDDTDQILTMIASPDDMLE